MQREAFMVRKPEKGTGPKIFYLGAEESVIRPEAAVRPLYYKEGQVHLRPIGAPEEDPESPGRSARRLRRAARQAVGRRHGPLPLHEGGLDRRDAARRDPVAARLRRPAGHDRGAGDLDGVHRADGGGPGHRSRAAGALLLHPHALELAIVDGVGRVVPDRRTARSASLWLVGRLVRLDAACSTAARVAGDRRSRSSRPPTRASCSRRGSGAISGRGRTRRSTSSRSRAPPARRRCCSPRSLIGDARRAARPLLGWILAGSLLAARADPAVRERAVAEPDAASRARGADDPPRRATRRSSGASRSPAAACCRSRAIVALGGTRARGRHRRRSRCWRSPAAPRGNTSGSRRGSRCLSVEWPKADGKRRDRTA